MSKNIIRDGYTRDGHINAVERLHDSLTFRYRPMLSEQVLSLDGSINKADPGDEALLIADELAKYLESWSEVDEHDKPVTIEFESIRRLPHLLLKKLHMIVAGVMASDQPPMGEASTDATKKRLQDLRSKAAGNLPGREALAEQQGNSAAG